jgi:hypothetical protein
MFLLRINLDVASRLLGRFPERVRDFLNDRVGRAYCDDCLQERLGLKWRQQVQTITATLAVTGRFARDSGRCSTCGQENQGETAA